jgi:hypothetical protein
MSVTTLQMSWTTSRGRETYGYNIARLEDTSTGKRHRCMGGGYDMQGTVFAEWLQENYQDDLVKIADRAHSQYLRNGDQYTRQPNNDAADSLYGMTMTRTPKMTSTTVTLDGGCGLQSIETIAKEIGLDVSHSCNRRGHLLSIIVTDPSR